ncbi:MAG: hypothetical protein HS117_17960 [Verrucomicrobiaceae bacterium]|nr:hypothetical protein [Verrucomicrobiaceae bacterium]
MLQTLDVALGLSFIFFLFSVLVSTVSEMILSWTNQRGKMLWKALSHLLPQKGHGTGTEPLKDFVTHPLMAAMHRHTTADAGVARDFPSYLGNQQFSQVLMDLLETKGAAAGGDSRWKQVVAGIEALPETSRAPLLALSRDAERNLLPGQQPQSVFQFLAIQWFDAMMDRTTGWYKRLTQVWNFCLGIVLAVMCNLNVIAITKALSTNDELRAAFVQKAEASVKAQSELAARMGVEQSKGARAVFDEAVSELSDAGFPVGWSKSTARAWATHPVSTLFESLLGWLMAGAAAALGAQFWFDLMKKIVNLRGTGTRPGNGSTPSTSDGDLPGPIPPAGYIYDAPDGRQG